MNGLSDRRIEELIGVYRDGSLDDLLPFWMQHAVEPLVPKALGSPPPFAREELSRNCSGHIDLEHLAALPGQIKMVSCSLPGQSVAAFATWRTN